MEVQEYIVTQDMKCLECEESVSEGSTLKSVTGVWFCSNCEEYDSLGE